VIISTIIIVICIRRRKDHLESLEKKIQLNMDIEVTKDVELTGKGMRKN